MYGALSLLNSSMSYPNLQAYTSHISKGFLKHLIIKTNSKTRRFDRALVIIK